MKLKNTCSIAGIVLVLLLKYASSTQLPGEIYPPNVEIEVGDSVNITCQLNPLILKDYNASALRFVNDDTQMPIPDEDVVIVNSTTIMYMLRNAKEQSTSLLCKCGNNGIMISKLYVGYKPLPVKHLHCRSYDFEYMTCNFTQPINRVITNYNLSYYVDTPQYKYYPECINDGRQHITCNTTLQIYKYINQEQYHFMLYGKNELGSNLEHFTFNNWEIMMPAAPGENVRVINVDNSSLHIAWRIPKWDKYRPKVLRWEILLKPDSYSVRNLSNTVTVTRIRGEMNLRLNNLPYSWYWYDLNVRMRINLPNAQWSQSFVYRFRTASTRPVLAPRVQPGGFYIDSTETQIRLYWEQLKEYEQNGDNFTYIISNVKKDGQVIEQKAVRFETNSATFLWQKNAKYEFEIRSWNIMGPSLESSQLIINPLTNKNARRHTPRAIQNVYHATNGTYTLTWQAPAELEQLKDYTVYWCVSKRALQNECKGSIHSAYVPADVHKFTTAHQEHTLNLAVSANYIDYNTGMHWTDCTQDVNSDLVKMEPEIQAISATSLKIQWSPEGVCPSILIGYNITYCEVLNKSSPTCLNQNVIEINNHAKKYVLTDLKPYTYYKIEMLMHSPFKVGKISDAQLVRTYEAAPSAPRQLQLLHVGNVSATVTWLPPTYPNGVLRSYTIYLNDKKFELSVDADEPFAKISFLLTNLKSFTAYKVYVTAHNSLTSKPSNDIHFTTLIGYPSKPDTADYSPGNNTVIKWSKPIEQSGRLEYYEVNITQLRNDKIVKSYVNYITTSTACLLRQLPICPSSDYKTTVQVRAVNAALLSHEVDMSDVSYETVAQPTNDIDQDSEDYLYCDDINARDAKQTIELLQRYQNDNIYRLYKSEWQMGPTYSCSANRYNKLTTIALAIIVFVIALMIAVYMAGKKYKKMANIHCTLPEGLESYFEKDLCSNSGSSAAIINDALSYSHTDFVKSVLDCDDDFNLHDRTPNEHQQSSQQQHKYLMQHEQEQHLLEASIGNDSGYLGDLRAFDSCVQHLNQPKQQENFAQQQQHNHVDLMQSTSIDSLVDSTLSLSNENLNKFSPPTSKKQTAAPIIVVGGGGGYIKPENLFNWPEQQSIMTSAPSNNCDYMTIDAIKAIQTQPIISPPPPPANFGYVHPSQLQKLTQNEPINDVPVIGNNISNNLNGYTTLAQLEQARQLSRMVPPNAITSSLQQQQTAPQSLNGASGQISGYVTQSDLNMFAHKQHNQQPHQQQQHGV